MTPVHWLTDQSAALQAIAALAALPLLAYAGWFARKAAKAAEDQAKAANAQIDAAEAASRVSERQLEAALESAEAQRAQSQLIREQTLASFYPVVSFRWRHIDEEGLVGYLVNESAQALAIDIAITWQSEENQLIVIETNTLGPHAETKLIGMLRNEIKKRGVLIAKYKSIDGRSFVTEVRVRQSEVVQMNSETNPDTK